MYMNFLTSSTAPSILAEVEGLDHDYSFRCRSVRPIYSNTNGTSKQTFYDVKPYKLYRSREADGYTYFFIDEFDTRVICSPAQLEDLFLQLQDEGISLKEQLLNYARSSDRGPDGYRRGQLA